MIRLVLLTLLIVAIVATAALLLRRTGCIPVLRKPTPPSTVLETTTEAIILNQLRLINELTTSIHGVVTIISTTEKKSFVGVKLGSTKLLYMGVGKIRAGIDLSRLTQDSVIWDGNTVYIRLPEMEILDVSLDVEQSKVLNIDRSALLSPWGEALQSEAEKRALQEMRLAASRQEWVRQAVEEHTMEVMGALLKLLGVKEARVGWEVMDG